MTKQIGDVVAVLSERVSDITKDNNQSKRQRRNQVVDIFGMEFTRQGDTNHPAQFYLSISPDLIYYERFEFKIIVAPFAMPVGSKGGTSDTTVIVEPESLYVENDTITPNPHDHDTVPHRHAIEPGLSLFESTVSGLTLWIDGVDITEYLKEQHDGAWIDGEGVFPGVGFNNYDILGIIGSMPQWKRGVILKPGYKLVEVRGKGIFNVTLVNYVKYSHINR